MFEIVLLRQGRIHFTILHLSSLSDLGFKGHCLFLSQGLGSQKDSYLREPIPGCIQWAFLFI